MYNLVMFSIIFRPKQNDTGAATKFQVEKILIFTHSSYSVHMYHLRVTFRGKNKASWVGLWPPGTTASREKLWFWGKTVLFWRSHKICTHTTKYHCAPSPRSLQHKRTTAFALSFASLPLPPEISSWVSRLQTVALYSNTSMYIALEQGSSLKDQVEILK